MTANLFTSPDFRPLAEKMRPTSIIDFVGQDAILGINTPLRNNINAGHIYSMILWGPPGCGKTTLSSVLANIKGHYLVKISAIFSGVKDIKEEIKQAQNRASERQLKTILFVDEIHRFNKSQQDAFLPYVENGDIILIGATTENPSFSLNNALISRVQVYIFKPLQKKDLEILAQKACKYLDIELKDTSIDKLYMLSGGDARKMYNLIETSQQLVVNNKDNNFDFEQALDIAATNQVRNFDNQGDWFYDLISALHKSIRGSNPHAAMYWFCRMIDGGCDINYLARRLTIIASEDIGNADPRALEVALNGWQAYERIGSPEGNINLAQVVTYLACAAKSNASYLAYKEALSDISSSPSYPVPNHLVNAPTKLMQQIGKGQGYRYAHDEPNAYAAGENYFPENMPAKDYYRPNKRGLEIKISEKLELLKELDDKINSNKKD